MIPRRPIPIILISGNNKTIAEVDVFIKKLVYMLKKLSIELPDKQYYFAVLLSLNGGEWVTGERLIVDDDFCLSEEESSQRRKEIKEYNNMPSLIRNGREMKDDNVFTWHDMDFSHKCNLTDILHMLNEGLSMKKILSNPIGILPPRLILFYNGFPSSDCKKALKLLQENRWYQHSMRIAIVCDTDTDENILNEFTENTNAVLNLNDPELLQKTYQIINLGILDG